MKTTKELLAGFVILFAGASLPAQAEVTIKDLVTPDGIQAVALSPDGKHMAMIGFTGRNHGLFMVDADTNEAKLIKTGKWVNEGAWNVNKEPRNVRWVTNDLLAVDYGPEAESLTMEGKKVADLGAEVLGKIDAEHSDSPILLIYSDWDREKIALANARTGEITKIRYPMSGIPTHWVFDSHGVLRALTLSNSAFWKDATTVTNWYRASDKAEWEKLAEFKVTDNYWVPLSISEAGDSLVISSSVGRDTRAIFSYNTQTHEIGDMLAGHPTQDIVQVDGASLAEFKSVVTSGMIPQRYWFDHAWGHVQATADAALPNRINKLSGNPEGRVLVYSYSDVDPGRWYLLDMQNLKMHEVAQVRTSIDVSQLHRTEVIAYPSTDGLSIPAYLTRPAGSQKMMPTIVMIHGGPTVRDNWGFSPDVQLLASHGYAVFQPQFRGSSGFGSKFEEAGYGQWGLAMQDDVTAGVQYLIQQGIADPKRICVYGASYGGYAALWGLVKTPDLYRCGISFAGVSDIEYMLNDSSDRNDDKVGRQMQRSRIGDAKLNKEQFDSVSPLKHADLIKAPILLMHGEDDVRVPISHSKKMMDALDQNHKTYEWHKFEDEGHGLTYVRDLTIYYETMLKFLDKYNPPDAREEAPQTTVPVADVSK
jgi:dienelactone hydrolase